MSRLERRKPLARGRGFKVAGGSPRRTRIARVGRRAKASLDELRTFRRYLLARAKDRCERCGRPCSDEQLEAHHLLPRSRGGKHDAKTNGAALCRGEHGCHMRVHRHEVEDWRRWLKTRRSA